MAKIILIDVETSPILAHVWGTWDQNVSLDQIDQEWTILSYCAKWLEEDELIYEDTGGKGKKRVREDKGIVRSIRNLLDKADIVIAQNGNKFDIRKINARIIEHGLDPYSPIRVVDTLTVAKKHFGFTSNKLAWLAAHLTDTKKEEHKEFPGFQLWTECLKDNPKAWQEMQDYNKKDVIALEKLYLRLRPWISNHPNIPTFTATEGACPKCGSSNIQRRGVSVLQQGRYQRFQCQDCSGWSRGKEPMMDIKVRRKLMV